jgi:hypothetical protein
VIFITDNRVGFYGKSPMGLGTRPGSQFCRDLRIERLLNSGSEVPPMNSGNHYHIRWSKSNVDWKPFPTSEEARREAEWIKKPNESYVIEERDSGCESCRAFKSKAATLFDRVRGQNNHAL